MGYTGRGVRVCVIDDGLEHAHDDLRDNYVSVLQGLPKEWAPGFENFVPAYHLFLNLPATFSQPWGPLFCRPLRTPAPPQATLRHISGQSDPDQHFFWYQLSQIPKKCPFRCAQNVETILTTARPSCLSSI